MGVYPRPSSHFPSQYHESLLPSPPSCLGITSTCTSRSSEASGGTEAARNMPTSPSSLLVKEEPCDVDAVLIEWELSEERAAESQEQPGSPCPDQQSPHGKHDSPGVWTQNSAHLFPNYYVYFEKHLMLYPTSLSSRRTSGEQRGSDTERKNSSKSCWVSNLCRRSTEVRRRL